MTPLLPILSPRLEDALAHPDCLESLKGMRFGLEKEGLRVDKNTGALAQTPHAKALGSALTHPNITTDYSEALLEFVTATHETPQAALAELESLQAYSASVLGDERIWPLSMPCLLPESDSDIPLAYYGESYLGRLKTVYRRGLGFRYGRQMQTIAGVHFNLSWDDAFWHWRANLDGHAADNDHRQIRDTGYFHTIRNYRRIQWLFMLLTGASPAVDASFRLLAMDRFQMSDRTRIAADATSLRMSDLGYQSAAQESINICFNHLDTYCETLARAVHQPWPTYEGLGLKDQAGYKQLNTAVLQIENEYYSSIRPKRVQKASERPVRALINRGVEYLEIRAIDLNPYARNGISETEACLITLLMTACAIADSPQIQMQNVLPSTDSMRVPPGPADTAHSTLMPSVRFDKPALKFWLHWMDWPRCWIGRRQLRDTRMHFRMRECAYRGIVHSYQKTLRHPRSRRVTWNLVSPKLNYTTVISLHRQQPRAALNLRRLPSRVYGLSRTSRLRIKAASMTSSLPLSINPDQDSGLIARSSTSNTSTEFGGMGPVPDSP